MSKPCRAIRLTESDLNRLDNHAEKCALAIGERFGEVDEGLVRLADELLDITRRWAADVRQYLNDKASEGETWEL